MRPTRPPARLPIFRSAEQARLLTLLYLGPARRWTLEELGGGQVSRATTEREVATLVEAGMVAVETAGRTRLFSAPAESPLHRPLRELLERTIGVEPRLRSALASVAGIEAAGIYGSWAAGSRDPASDIDLLVVGDSDHSEIAEATMPVAEELGREINVVTVTPAELRDRMKAGDSFFTTVVDGKLLPLIGDVRQVARGK